MSTRITYLERSINYLSGLIVLALLSCCSSSFDRQVAVNEFRKLKPACEIIAMKVYDCDGTLGECMYVEFSYTCSDQPTVIDTTLQYWRKDNRWITAGEYSRARDTNEHYSSLLLSQDSTHIGLIAPDTVLADEELVAKLYIHGSELRLIGAFLNCPLKPDTRVDTSQMVIDGCSKKLLTQNDTIYVGFRPHEPGLHSFGSISVLVQDNRGTFRGCYYSFRYYVHGR